MKSEKKETNLEFVYVEKPKTSLQIDEADVNAIVSALEQNKKQYPTIAKEYFTTKYNCKWSTVENALRKHFNLKVKGLDQSVIGFTSVKRVKS